MGAKVSRRVFLKVAGSLAGAAALAACAPAQQKKGLGPHGGVATQLVYQDWRTDYFSAMAQQMLEEFHATHPNIHVFYTPDPPDELSEKMLADFQAESAPDVFAGCCEFFPVWAQKGYLLDLRPYVEAELRAEEIKEWDDAQLRALRLRDGTQYALPKYHGALAVYYNKDLFDKYNVSYPAPGWTHGDYQRTMLAFAQQRSAGSDTAVWGSMFDVSWDRIQVHVNAWGGHFVDPNDPTKSMMGRPETIDAMQWLRDRMWSDHAMASRLDVQNLNVTEAFLRGRLAMVEDGSWSLKNILANAKFRVGVATFPAGPAGQVTMGTTDGFGIYKGTRYPEAAWEFMKFLISPRYGRAMARAHLLQPARSSLVDEWIAQAREQYPEKAQEMNLAAFAEGHLKGYSVTPEIFANQDIARRLTSAAWEQIFTLGRARVTIMTDVSEQIEAAQKTAAPTSALEARRAA
ncbi:MAG: sugar ABC transporter substrate-binding protein [Anaerolineae bacterium]|jgi:multiple sugar transport system substrate-binding protein|nr:sugar ABC transporter substrate-binding protein [Anaerolineae bacterium]